MDSDNLLLTAGDVTAQVDPLGARLVSLVVAGQEVIVPLDEEGPVFSGAFPMIPWCGLVRDARLDVDGREHRLRADWDEHALHGVARDASWTVVSAAPGQIQFELELPDSWPFGGRAAASFALSGTGLHVRWTVEAGEQEMPAALGWHPWFRRTIEAAELELHQGFTAQWARSDIGVPLGAWRTVTPAPWDDSFLSSEPVTLAWGDVLTMQLCGTGGVYSVYDGSDKGVVVATQTSPHERLGHRLLPGAALTLEVVLSWGQADGSVRA